MFCNVTGVKCNTLKWTLLKLIYLYIVWKLISWNIMLANYICYMAILRLLGMNGVVNFFYHSVKQTWTIFIEEIPADPSWKAVKCYFLGQSYVWRLLLFLTRYRTCTQHSWQIIPQYVKGNMDIFLNIPINHLNTTFFLCHLGETNIFNLFYSK